MKIIQAQELVSFNRLADDYPLDVDLVYAQPGHPENLFGPVYRADAQCWAHRDLAAVVTAAAVIASRDFGWRLIVKDCLRTVEAQKRIGDAPISKSNPHWFEEPRLMSPPGAGAHPRGMAVDIDAVYAATREKIDFGTVFDHMGPESARDFTGFDAAARDNRARLEDAMMTAAAALGQPLHPLQNEWWDFRFPAEIYADYAPLSDDDLPPAIRMTT